MKRGRVLVGVLVLFLIVVLVGSVVAIFSMLRGGGGSVEDGSTLVLNIGGALPEQPMPDDGLAALTGGTSTSVLEFDSALRKAAVDDRVARVLVEPGAMATGYAKVFELRDALRRFSTDSGKPVLCWMEAASNKEYLLATGCDEIYMAPAGFLLVNGLHFGVTFYKGTLDKLGVEADFARAGKYKSAVEPLTSEEMSPAFRSMLESMADSLYGEFVAAIAQGRGMDEAAVRALVDDPPLTAAGGVRAGLIDGLLYRDQLLAKLQGDEVEPISADAPRLGLLLQDELANESPHPGRSSEADGASGAPLASPADAEALPAEADPGDTEPAAAGAVAEPVPPEGSDAAEEAPADGSGEDAVDEGAPTDGGEANASAEGGEAAGEGGREGFEDPDPDLLSLSEYARVRPSSLGLGEGDKIAVIYCEGQIMSGESSPAGGMSGATMGSDTIAGAIRKARKDDSIKAIVLRVDSPGGSGLASDIIWREAVLARRVKPLVVTMSDYAASGGYYISMAADAIVAQPTTLTGSIGVFGGKYNLGGLYAKLGMRTDDVKRGELADIFAADRGLGEAGHRKFSEFIDEFYETFISKAGEGRGVSALAIHEHAQGRVWTGAQAREVGLVDELGNLRTALKIAREKAGIEEDPRLVLMPRQRTPLERLLERGAGTSLQALLSRTGLLDGVALRGPSADPSAAIRHLWTAAPLLASGEPVLMAPYHLDLQ